MSKLTSSYAALILLVSSMLLSACSEEDSQRSKGAQGAGKDTSDEKVLAGIYSTSFEPAPSNLCPDFSTGVILSPNADFNQRYDAVKENLNWDESRAFGPTVFFRVRGRLETDETSAMYFGAIGIFHVTTTEQMILIEDFLAQRAEGEEKLAELCATYG